MHKEELISFKIIEIIELIYSTIMSVFQDILSYGNLVHAVAGATGATTAMTVFFPLDTARVRLQVDDNRIAKHSHVVIAEIIKEEGFFSLYRGWFPVVSSLCVSSFVYFYTYNGLKKVFLNTDKQEPGKNLILAAISGVVNVLFTTPLWVVNTRLKLQGVKYKDGKEKKQPRYKGIIDAFLQIIRLEGVSVLWSGTMPSLVLVANPALQFMVYEFLKKYFQKAFGTEVLSGFMYFLLGAISKTVTTIVTYPLQVVQSRLRAEFNGPRDSNNVRPRNMLQVFNEILRMRGFKGLYKGMEAKLLQTVLTTALMFVSYEKIAAFIFLVMRQQNPVNQ